MAKNDLMHGNTSLLVLSLIGTQDMYGYQIIKELKRKSENVFELKEGSLYPVLHALENEKLITSYIEETDSARKRRYYKITDKGIKELADKKEEFFTFTNAARKVLTFAWGDIMSMRKFYNFEEAKEIYVEQVLYHIHYGKLKKRIKAEIENHMDDMYDDFKNDFDNELDVAKKVVDEMGDPDELGLELKETNKRTLWVARFFKIAIGISAIPLAFLFMVLISNIYSEVNPYFSATDIETKEMRIVEKYNDGQPIKFLFETEVDGIVHRYYLPETQNETNDILFHTQSIKVFGISVKDKFVEYGRSSGPLDNEMIIQTDISVWLHDSYLVLTAPAEYKYVRFKFQYDGESTDDNSTAFWSDYIEIPSNITYDNPFICFIDCPDGCYWFQREFYNENKEVYELTVETTDRQWSSSTTFW